MGMCHRRPKSLARATRHVTLITRIHCHRSWRPAGPRRLHKTRSLDDLTNKLDKRSPDVLGCLGAGLAEERPMGLGQRAALLGRDLPAMFRLVQL